MLSCYFDIIGTCEMFSTDETVRPCMCDDPRECDFYISDKDVHLAAKKCALDRAVKKCLRNIENKDGE